MNEEEKKFIKEVENEDTYAFLQLSRLVNLGYSIKDACEIYFNTNNMDLTQMPECVKKHLDNAGGSV